MTTDTDQKYIDDLVTHSEETLALWSNEEKQTKKRKNGRRSIFEVPWHYIFIK
jgi:hypothetical protein